MKIAYLMNTYPLISTTFIRNEILAHEAAGQPIHRFAVRRWDGELVDPRDTEEARRTTYLLSGNAAGLATAVLREVVANPRGMARAISAAAGLVRAARGGLVRHAAYLAEAVALKQACARAGIGHIHAHFATNPAAVAMIARRLGGPSYSFTVHGSLEDFSDVGALALRAKIDGARFVVAITAYCREVLAGIAAPHSGDKIHVVRCGIDLGAFEARPAVSAPRLVCVGRLCRQKAQVLIVEAAARLAGAFPGLKIVLVGDGETRPDVEAAIARHGLGGTVDLHGWGTSDEVRRILADSRALVLPSFAEGLPIVIMEAFAMGRPVISTRIAGIPELVDARCGWLVDPGEVEALAASMHAALAAGEDEIAALGAEGRHRIETLHDQDANATALRHLFAEHA